MSFSEKDFPSKLKKLGISIYEGAKKGVEYTKASIEKTILDEQLKRRFNNENPYKFIIFDEDKKPTIIDEILTKNAKRYVENDLFVFYKSSVINDLYVGKCLRDLSVNKDYKVVELVNVTIPVLFDGESVEVECIAAMCEECV